MNPAGRRARALSPDVRPCEGVDPVARRIERRCYSLTVATGTARAPGGRPGRRAQLSLMEVQLSVSVAARLEDGSTGPWSPDVSVGAPYP